MKKMKKAIIALSVVSVFLLLSIASATVHAVATLPNGFTAKIVATNNQVITGTIKANGYDIGVYVGPGVKGVVIKNADISGANDHGIYIQDTSDVIVRDSNITGNGLNPYGGPGYLTEDKAITLAGTHDIMIKNNVVSNNWADGGISIIDDGPVHPAQPNPGSLYASYNNVVMGNLVEDNAFGCGIVVASKNIGAGVSNNLIRDNTVIGNSPPASPPEIYVGAIVVAGIYTANTVVINNTVIGGWLPGIVVHSFKPGDVVDGTIIQHNTLMSNSADEVGDGYTAGISLFAAQYSPPIPSATISNTLIAHNTVINDHYGVWHVGDTDTKIIQLKGNADVPIAP
jgi:hypothetical protein